MKYTDYTVEDFVLDERFRNWVLSRQPREEIFWREWIDAHPDMKPLLEEAREIILHLENEEIRVSQEKIEEQFKEVSEFFDQQFASEPKTLSWKIIGSIAASLLILVAAGIGIFYQPLEKENQQLADNAAVVSDDRESKEKKEENTDAEMTQPANPVHKKSGKTNGKSNEKRAVRKEHTGKKTTVDTTTQSATSPQTAGQKPGRKTIQYATAQGQQQKISLPDGSKAYLNENSSLTFAENWEKGNKRKVTLKGEAYFRVKEKQYQGNKVKFIVATRDMQVEVVGTKFTVRELTQNTRVFLQSGKIMLNLPDIGCRVEMQPNDMVEYNRESGNMKMNEGVNEARFISWVNNFDRAVRKAEQYMTNKKAGINNNEGSQGNNLTKVLQSGTNNSVYIEQIGDNLKSGQVQSGEGNRAKTNISGRSDGNDEVSWSTGQVQQGKNNMSVFNIVDSYNSNMFSGQAGEGNVVKATSKGEDNMGMTIQFGQNNQAGIYQEGSQNDVIILQKGQNNRVINPASQKSGAYQKGRYNKVNIIQQGMNNKSKTMQRGRNNKVNVNQKRK